MVDNEEIVAATAKQVVEPSATIDGVVSGATGDYVGSRRAGEGQRRGQRHRIDVLEVGDIRRVARRLIGTAEIDRRGCGHYQRVGAAAAGDRGFGSVISDTVIARTGVDDVGSACTVNGVVARTTRDLVRRRR